MADAPLVLASASPRRRELLQQLGVPFSCQPADVDETPRDGEAPGDYVARLAREKAEAVYGQQEAPAGAVLAADTTVALDGALLGKPRTLADGLATLMRLSGHPQNITILTGPDRQVIGKLPQKSQPAVYYPLICIHAHLHPCQSHNGFLLGHIDLLANTGKLLVVYGI